MRARHQVNRQFTRYQPVMGAQAEYEPGSHGRVLRNKQGIKRKCNVDQAEFEALALAQAMYVRIITEDTRFDAALLRRMHRDWLGDIYEWAGDYRKLDVSKGDFVWPRAAMVPDNMARLEDGVLAECTPCRAHELECVALDIARVHAELLLIHPFREGNGRLARWLADLMALQAGYPAPLYPFNGRGSREQKARYLAAVAKGYNTDYADLAAFFEEMIRRSC